MVDLTSKVYVVQICSKVFANMSQTAGEKNPVVSIELGETT